MDPWGGRPDPALLGYLAQLQWGRMTPEQQANQLRQAGEQRENADRHRTQRLARDAALRDRREEALEALRELGSPGLKERQVLGVTRQSRLERLIGSSHNDAVQVERAWLIGMFSWVYRHRRYRNLSTGVTPSGRIVPMQYATRGDGIEGAWADWRINSEPSYVGPRDARLTDEDVVAGLEAALARARP